MTRRQNEEVRKKKLIAEQKARAEQEAREKAEKERREKLLSSVKGISELYRQAVEEAEIARTILKVLKSSVREAALHNIQIDSTTTTTTTNTRRYREERCRYVYELSR